MGLKVYFTYSIYTCDLLHDMFFFCTEIYEMQSGFIVDGAVLEECDLGVVFMLLYSS